MKPQQKSTTPGAITTTTCVVFVAAFVIFLVSSGFRHTVYDAYVTMASAWLEGHLWVASPPPSIDAVYVNGNYYIIEGPMPALLLLPAVALFGRNANQEFICVVCAAIATAAAFVVLERMGMSKRAQIGLSAFFALGTAVWWCTAFGATWMYAGVVAAMFAMLALAEWYGNRRPWLVGLLIMCGALARFPLVLSLLPLAAWLWALDRPDTALRDIGKLALGAVPVLIVSFLYNYARYHTFADIGYAEWYHHDQVGQATGSPFRLQYLPFNLYSYFFLTPEFASSFPWLRPTGFGVSLTLTSPALFLALAAPWRDKETWALAAATLLVAAPSLLYYVNGFEQFGMRHSLDFVALLLPLVARGMQRVPAGLSAPLVAYSITANAFGVWYSWAYHAFTVVPG